MVAFIRFFRHTAEKMICFRICFKRRDPSCFPPANACFLTAHLFEVNRRIVASLTYCRGESELKVLLRERRGMFVIGRYARTGLLKAFWTCAALDPPSEKENEVSSVGFGDGERASSSTCCIALTSKAVTN